MTLNEFLGYVIKLAGALTILFTAGSAISKFIEDRFFKGQGLGNKIWAWVTRSSKLRKENAKKLDQLLVEMSTVKKEVTYNGGSSLKDFVRELKFKLDHTALVASELLIRKKAEYELNGDMKFMLDQQGNMYQPSKALLKFLKCSEQDLAGRGWQNRIPSDQWATVTPLLHNALKHVGTRFESIHTMTDFNNEEHECLMVAIPLTADDGSLMGFMGQIDLVES